MEPDRTLTPEALTEIREAVKRWKRGCPMCGAHEWNDPDQVDGLSPPEHVGTDARLWVFPLTCMSCGFVALLSAGFLRWRAGRTPQGEDRP